MKKQLKVIGFAALAAFVAVSGASAATLVGNADLCGLIKEFQGIFKLLRTLAFLGAGFLIAKWGWGYISSEKEVKVMDEVKGKGVSMLLGFILLFGVGAFLQVITTAAGLDIVGIDCPELFNNW